jgi:segregation and condensation protein A
MQLVSENSTESEGYKIRTEQFEGPLDLLLHLIKKNKMDIMEVKISEITSEYLYYLRDRSRINPSREGDFLMTAATLIYIKSRSLLPKPEILQDEDSVEDRLINTLIEYDKIQKISYMLKDMEAQTLVLWKREEITEKFESREFELEEVSSFQLAEVFLNIVKKKEGESFLYIDSKEYSIERKWNEILALLEPDGYLDFFEYVATLETIQDVLVSFFCILEMIKRRVIVGVQKKLFGTISLWKKTEEDDLTEVEIENDEL